MNNIRELIERSRRGIKFVALIIAVPLGIFITWNKAVSNVVIGIANVMQSIPCMALLAMGIPFLGVGCLLYTSRCV